MLGLKKDSMFNFTPKTSAISTLLTLGSFKKYETVGGGWVCASYVGNCYEKYRVVGVKVFLLCSSKNLV